jgi:type IV secretory pathway TrbL component
MNGFRISALLAALLAGAALNGFAQSTPTGAAKKDAPVAAKKDAPAAKDSAKKAAPKTPADKKDETKPEKKAAAKPVKKAERKPEKKVQKAAPAGTGPVVEKYKAGEAPNLQGRDGNVIQTSPDAYNIDSARKK